MRKLSAVLLWLGLLASTALGQVGTPTPAGTEYGPPPQGLPINGDCTPAYQFCGEKILASLGTQKLVMVRVAQKMLNKDNPEPGQCPVSADTTCFRAYWRWTDGSGAAHDLLPYAEFTIYVPDSMATPTFVPDTRVWQDALVESLRTNTVAEVDSVWDLVTYKMRSVVGSFQHSPKYVEYGLNEVLGYGYSQNLVLQEDGVRIPLGAFTTGASGAYGSPTKGELSPEQVLEDVASSYTLGDFFIAPKFAYRAVGAWAGSVPTEFWSEEERPKGGTATATLAPQNQGSTPRAGIDITVPFYAVPRLFTSLIHAERDTDQFTAALPPAKQWYHNWTASNDTTGYLHVQKMDFSTPPAPIEYPDQQRFSNLSHTSQRTVRWCKNATLGSTGIQYYDVIRQAGAIFSFAYADTVRLFDEVPPADTTYVLPTVNHVMVGRDAGHSGVFDATFPEYIQNAWSKPGTDGGAPVLVLGNNVVSGVGSFFDTDSFAVVCRDTNGVLKWSTILPDTLPYTGLSWPLAVTDSSVYAGRCRYGEWNAIYALNIINGSVRWVTANQAIWLGPVGSPPTITLLSDGDIVGWAYDPAGKFCLGRFEADDGTLVWFGPNLGNFISSGIMEVVPSNYQNVPIIVGLNHWGGWHTTRAADGALLTYKYKPGCPDGGSNCEGVNLTTNAAICDTAMAPLFMGYTGQWLRWGFASATEGVLSFQRWPFAPGETRNNFAAFLKPPVAQASRGPFLVMPGDSLTAYTAASWRVVGDQLIRERLIANYSSGMGAWDIISDSTGDQVIIAERGIGFTMYKGMYDPNQNGMPAVKKWTVEVGDPFAIERAHVWAQGSSIYINAGGEWAKYTTVVTPPGRRPRHGEVIEPAP